MLKYIQMVFIGILLISLVSCSTNQQSKEGNQMDIIAEGYVKLVLNIGLYDSDYVDAYYGPEDWRPSDLEKQDTFPYQDLKKEVLRLIELTEQIDTSKLVGLEKQRHLYLAKQLKSVRAKIEMLNGKHYSFDEESELLYDAIAPTHDESHFQELISKLENLIPGTGNLSERWNSYEKDFIIPEERLDTIFKVAIAECRKRTLNNMELPENEKFLSEFVTGKPWRLYNFYKGNSFSVIQINTDLPIPIFRAINGGAHEGYPGHHICSTLIDKFLVVKKGWIEHSIIPLFSPMLLIMEGLARFAQELVMPLEERIPFEREVLFPLAGLDGNKVEEYYRIRKIIFELGVDVVSEVARKYLDGIFTEEQAINWLIKYGLFSPDDAHKRLNFIQQLRSYVINYDLGYDIVKKYIESGGATQDNIKMRWKLYKKLLTTPLIPSDLIKETKKVM